MRRSAILLPLLAALGVAVGLGAAATFAAPRIASVSPAPGATGISALAPVEIAFTRPMRPESAQERFSVTGGVRGAFEWQGNTLVFRPQDGWPMGSLVTVRLAAGSRSTGGLPVLSAWEWSFTIGQPRVAFLLKAGDQDNQGNQWINVWAALAGGGEPRQITQEAGAVYDFAPSPDGTQIAYSVRRADGGADLRLVRADGQDARDLLPCPGEACVSPAWSPDGATIAFERRPLRAGVSGQTIHGDPIVWLLDMTTGQSAPLGENPGDLTGSPRWSPDGSRLAYYDRTLGAIAVHDFRSGAVSFIPATSGEMGSWSSDGAAIVFPEILFSEQGDAGPTPAPGATPGAEGEGRDRFYSHLLRVNVATNEMLDLSGEALVEDLSAAYSPTGEWIAFARKFVDERWTPGRQLWLMRADGGDQHPLTADPNYNHSAILWSRDGRSLIFQRFDVTAAATPAEIWAINADGADLRRIISGGYLPAWLP